MKKGSLTVVGTGLQVPGQMTLESKEFLSKADKVFYVVPDPIANRYIKSLNETAEDLYPLYEEGLPRVVTYQRMVDTILEQVRQGKSVCAAFYGHPGVFAFPSHESIRVARSEGYHAVMVPGVSAEDCLVADLGLDPAGGCISYEATGFVIQPMPVETTGMLILWQVGVIGELRFRLKDGGPPVGIQLLTDKLLKHYSENHIVIVYEASFTPAWPARIERIPLHKLPAVKLTGISTLVVPPADSTVFDEDMIQRLGVDTELFIKKTLETQI